MHAFMRPCICAYTYITTGSLCHYHTGLTHHPMHSGWPFPNAWAHPTALSALNASALPPPGRGAPAVAGGEAFGDFTDEGGVAMSEVWSGVVGVRKSEAAVYRDIVLKWRGCALKRRCLSAYAWLCVCVCVYVLCGYVYGYRVRACVVRVPSSVVLFVRVTCVWCLC